jgi:hypothetical protein
MTPHDRGPDRSEAGFVLIGVVIFVLALTIIGISLFSLSSYEAQFLQRSIDREQAFQTAVGGIERAKFALGVPPHDLGSVTENLPAGVSAVAVQVQHGDSMSAGLVVWDPGSPVLIRVTAGPAGARRTVEACFTPIRTLSYYSSLITVSEGIRVLDESPLPPEDRERTVLLDGPVWESSGQPRDHWLDPLRPPEPDSIRTSPAVPVPDVTPYLASPGLIDWARPADKGEPATESVIYTLDASATPGVPAYFTAEDTDPDFSLNTRTPLKTACTIQVRGLAVWLLPRGALFYMDTEVTGDPGTACLVVIAGRKTPTGSFLDFGPTASICFEGHLQAQIPVIFVSSGKVLLWHQNDHNESTLTTDQAIFARSVEFMGPDANATPSLALQLHRYADGPLNTLFLDALAGQGALPNATSSGGRRLDLIPGTWQASDR